ncbi:MAG: M48 family metallopeptidase [Mariprofundaceae bacterium]|nr:M48 family metallopeptidase [Mariprofundaceae bacterium]
MNFFEAQEQARKHTSLLVVLFLLAVICIVAAVYAAVAIITPFLGIENYADHDYRFLDAGRIAWVAGITTLIILGGSLYKIIALRRDGGKGVAESLGGKRIPPNSPNSLERRLLNVVEEMAIASGLPVPPVFMLEESGINAFAVGFSPRDAAVGVTRGCVELLSRDQLQGVIAHEFSHLLNGDTTIKMRLMGVLFGIMLISDMGIRILTGSVYVSGRRTRYGRQGNVLPWMLLGFLLFMVGTVGLVFGDLIKRALSRQREFLADAAAVQFTRNPEGIAGALKVMGGYKQGSRIVHPGAHQASHLFFGNALKSWMATDWWATHPPLIERIRRIDPVFHGKLENVDAGALAQRNLMEAEAFVSALASRPSVRKRKPTSYIAQVGKPQLEHIQYARHLTGTLPPSLRDLVHEPFAARAVAYGLLLDANSQIRKQQIQALHAEADPEVFQLLLDIESGIRKLDASLRLPLADMLLPALEYLSPAQYRIFRKNMQTLIKANGKLSLFEYVIHRIVLRHLDGVFGQVQSVQVKFIRLAPLMGDARIVLGFLAWVGERQQSDAKNAYKKAMQALDATDEEALAERGTHNLKHVDAALKRMRLAAPMVKEKLLQACVTCVMADNHASVRETELLRAIADSLDCPMPPLLNESKGPAEIEWRRDAEPVEANRT